MFDLNNVVFQASKVKQYWNEAEQSWIRNENQFILVAKSCILGKESKFSSKGFRAWLEEEKTS